MVAAALARGHEVTIFNRGRTNPDLFPGVERLAGDRNTELGALAGREWDATVDTSAYVPRQVAALAAVPGARLGAYCLISTISVYPLEQADKSEAAPTLPPPADGSEDVDAHYGALKALCEEAAVEAFGDDGALIVRSGLLVGPWDPSNRFTHWVTRIAGGGEVLAPVGPRYAVQFIDARDQAEWVVRCLEGGVAGTFNCTGPRRPLPLGDLFEAVAEAAGGGAELTWVSDAFLQESGVAPWSELPLWIPGPLGTLHNVPIGRALDAGLEFRPVAATVADTLAWARAGGAGAPQVDSSGRRRPPGGLAPERERELLAAWHRREEGSP